jgi:hypothetical protein
MIFPGYLQAVSTFFLLLNNHTPVAPSAKLALGRMGIFKVTGT